MHRLGYSTVVILHEGGGDIEYLLLCKEILEGDRHLLGIKNGLYVFAFENEGILISFLRALNEDVFLHAQRFNRIFVYRIRFNFRKAYDLAFALRVKIALSDVGLSAFLLGLGAFLCENRNLVCALLNAENFIGAFVIAELSNETMSSANKVLSVLVFRERVLNFFEPPGFCIKGVYVRGIEHVLLCPVTHAESFLISSSEFGNFAHANGLRLFILFFLGSLRRGLFFIRDRHIACLHGFV